MMYRSVNPYNGTLHHTFAEQSDEQLEAALAAAAACFEAWWATTFAERAAIVTRAANLMHDCWGQFARLVTLETSKLIAEAQCEVELGADVLDDYATDAERFLAPQPPAWTAPDLPFSGVKDSGYGRELSGVAIQEFVKKLVHVAATRDAA